MANQAPAHWSKDFVEHLRTVHFTLIALCVGLIVLSSFQSKSEIEIAHGQASEILAVTRNWKEDFLQVEGAKVIEATIPPTALDEYLYTPDDLGSLLPPLIIKTKANKVFFHSDVIAPALVYPSWTIATEISSDLFVGTSAIRSPIDVELLSPGAAIRSPGPTLKMPKTLKYFSTLWDAMLHEQYLIVPQPPTECFEKFSGEWERCSVHSALSPQDGFPIEFIFRSADKNDFPQNAPKWNYEFTLILTNAEGTPRLGQIRLPVRNYRKIKFDQHQTLTDLLPKWNEKHKLPFKDAFRELAAVYGPMEDADISSVERILDAESRRTGEAFEAVGLKIPAEIAVRCGVLLILGVQFYMLIHLREFGNRLDREAGFEVAWIGVYTSNLARAMLFISLLLLPACTVVLLSIRGLRMTKHMRLAWAALAASNAASLVLSYFIFKVLPQPPRPAPHSVQVASEQVQPESNSSVEQHFE